MDAIPENRILTDAQVREIGLMVMLVKVLICASFVIGGWQAYVTLTINQHAAQIAKAEADALSAKLESANRLKEWSGWREQMVSISARQTTLLEVHQSEISQLQQSQGRLR